MLVFSLIGSSTVLSVECRVAYGATWVRHRYAEKIQKLAGALQEELKLLEVEITENG